MENSTYPYRINRFLEMQKSWNLEKFHDLLLAYSPEDNLLSDFRQSVMQYVAKAFYFDITFNELEFMDRLEANIHIKDNITPNGAVVPKKEYQLEFNLVLRSWTKIIQEMTKNNPSLLTKTRMTPNVRIKFGEDPVENVGRGLNTAYPHSDAWVESSFGINCYAPIIGDIDNNNMDFYQPINPMEFKDEFLANAKPYTEMQWVLDYYCLNPNLRPHKGKIHFSDFALIHNTSRKPNSRVRVSIDTAIYVGEHSPHSDRADEYMNDIQIIGEDLFIATTRSIYENQIIDKKTHFSHYTSGTLKILDCK
jgi:hypothetical protein